MSCYFYDTCALLNAPNIFNEEDLIFISSITISELEGIKSSGTKDEEVKYKARKVLKLLEDNQDKYNIVLYNPQWDRIIKKYHLPDNNDSRIVVSAYSIFAKNSYCYFITSDLCCKKVAECLPKMQTIFRSVEDTSLEDYSGFLEVIYNELELSNFYSKILTNNINELELIENQYLIIKDKSNNVIDKYKWKDNKYEKVGYITPTSKLFGKVSSQGDIYQQLALDCLANNKISMLRGAAGTGKSYLSFGYMFSLLEKGTIDKIVIFCNTVATKGSAKLGFYPGSREEKLLDSQIGNFLCSKLGGRDIVEKLISDEQLVLLPMSDIRGYDTTGMNAAVYITEAQNLDIELMRLALQRIGDDCICILDGDSKAQVDLGLYAGSNNGMRRVSQVFRGEDIYGEVTLQNIKRSRIAELAEKM